MKQFRKSQFYPNPDKCPKCKKKLKYDLNISKALVSRLMQEEHGIKIMRRHILGVAECKCTHWVKLPQ